MTKNRIARLEDDLRTHTAAIKFLLLALDATAQSWVVKHELQRVAKAWDEMEKEDVGKKDG